MKIDRKELNEGFRETRKYLLSHHQRSEWHRCYKLSISGLNLRICARCSGIYPGIIAGFLTNYVFPLGLYNFGLLIFLPLPALLDWIITSFTKWNGYNVVRTLTGFLLGYGYTIALVKLLLAFDMKVILLGVVYGLIAGVLLWYREFSARFK